MFPKFKSLISLKQWKLRGHSWNLDQRPHQFGWNKGVRLHRTYFAYAWYILNITGRIVRVHKVCHLEHMVPIDFLYVNFSGIIPTNQFNLNRYFSLVFQKKVRCERQGCYTPEMEAFLLSRLQKIMSTFSFERIPMDSQAPKILFSGASKIGILFEVSVSSAFR